MNQKIMFQRTLIDPDSNIGFFSLQGDHVIIHGFDDFIGCKFGIDTALGVFSFVREDNCEDDTSDEFTEETFNTPIVIDFLIEVDLVNRLFVQIGDRWVLCRDVYVASEYI